MSGFRVLLLLGGNIGEVKSYFKDAMSTLESRGIIIELKSALYRTEPWGVKDQNWYLNQALQIRTHLQPIDLLSLCKEIEIEAGRSEDSHMKPRTLDIDLLLFEDWILTTEKLVLPHKQFYKRNFALIPACEIVPEWIHPVKKQSLKTLLLNSSDKLKVERSEQ